MVLFNMIVKYDFKICSVDVVDADKHYIFVKFSSTFSRSSVYDFSYIFSFKYQ